MKKLFAFKKKVITYYRRELCHKIEEFNCRPFIIRKV